jgi:hypothetical protein
MVLLFSFAAFGHYLLTVQFSASYRASDREPTSDPPIISRSLARNLVLQGKRLRLQQTKDLRSSSHSNQHEVVVVEQRHPIVSLCCCLSLSFSFSVCLCLPLSFTRAHTVLFSFIVLRASSRIHLFFTHSTPHKTKHVSFSCHQIKSGPVHMKSEILCARELF